MKIKAVIIEDMPQARLLLEADLKACCPQVEIAGTAGSVVEGAKLIKKMDPQLVFLDVELGDGTGFDLLEILPAELQFQLIFTTVSDEHAIRAFRFSAVDYLLKPIDPEELREAVDKASEQLRFSGAENRHALLEAMRSPQAPRKLALHTAEKISVVSIDDILYCEAERNYTTFHLQDGACLVVSRTLKEYEQMLQEYGFLRAHQSFLVNLAHVRAYDKKDGGYLNMAGGNLVPVSYRRRPQVLKAIEHL